MSKILEFFKGREVDLENTRVFVYYNKKRKAFTVKALEGIHKGKVILHTKALTLKGALFIVDKGQERIITENQKNISSGVSGYLISTEEKQGNLRYLKEIEYNDEITSFVYKEDLSTIVHFSNQVHLENSKIYSNS